MLQSMGRHRKYHNVHKMAITWGELRKAAMINMSLFGARGRNDCDRHLSRTHKNDNNPLRYTFTHLLPSSCSLLRTRRNLMSSARIFPLEIEELIIDVLADDEDRSPLMTCSLVCQAYLAACRKRLFASIALNGNPDLNTTPVSLITAVFEQLLAARPEIAGYIRNLDYSIRPADLTNSTIQNSLKQISRLESLTFSYYHRPAFDWSNHPARPAFLHLLHLPTLTRLNVFAINNFAVSDLVLCVNLKRLDIGRHTSAVNTANFPVENLPTQPVQLHEFTAEVVATTAIIELSTARRPDGKPVVDFGSLSKITIVIERRLEDHVIQELFKRCVSLTDVNLSCKPILS